MCKLCDEKVVILEKREDAQVQDNIERRPCLCLLSCFSLSDEQTAAPRAERGKRDKQQKPPIPPAIEHITRHHNESILQTQLPLRLPDETVKDKPIEQKDYWKKYRELDGVKKHVFRLRVQK